MPQVTEAERILQERRLKDAWIQITTNAKMVYDANISAGFTEDQALMFTYKFYEWLYSRMGK